MHLPLPSLFSWRNRLGFENRQRKRQPLRKRFVPTRRVRLEFDWLEQRLVPSTITWKAAVSGNWGTAANWTGGVVPGPADDVVIDAAGANYTITLNGSVSVNSVNINSSSATLWVQGGGQGVSASLTSATSFSNSGTIQLESIGGAFSDTVTVTSGTLTNAAGGTILVNAGTAGARTITGNVTNQGTITVASGITLTVNRTGGPLFTQNAGTIAGTGELHLTGGTFLFNGGTYTTAPILDGSALTFGAGASDPWTFIARSNTTLSGMVPQGATVWVQGSSAGNNALLTTQEGASNAGTVLLQSINATFSSQLSVGGSVFTNSPTGVISAGLGTGGARSITGYLKNQGQVAVAASETLPISGTYEAAGGTISGNAFVNNSNLKVTAAAATPTTIVLAGNTTLLTDNLANTTLWVQGGNQSSNATLTSATSFSNYGTIQLESIVGAFSDTVTVTSGTLTNAAGGSILVNAGTAGARTITGNVTNQGTITVASGIALTVNRTGGPLFTQNAGTIAGTGELHLTGGTFLFNGGTYTTAPILDGSALAFGTGAAGPWTFVVRSNTTLSGTVPQGATVWVQGSSAGNNALLTTQEGASNAGTVLLQSINATFSSQLSVGGSVFTNSPTGVISAGLGTGGARSITGYLKNQGQVAVAAGQTLPISGTYEAAGGTISGNAFVNNSNLKVTAAAATPTTIVLAGNTTLLTDNLANTTLWVQGGNQSSNATLTSATSFSNYGTIQLESIGGAFSDTVTVTSGTLTNAAGGTILVNAGTAGARTLSAELNNQGTVTFNLSASLGRASANHVNTGQITVNNVSVTVSGTSFTNGSGGVIAGVGTFSVAGVTFTNSGQVSPGLASTGILTVVGNYNQSSSGHLAIAIGGTTAGTQFDQLQDTGSGAGQAALAGTLDVSLLNGFTPTLGQTFQVMTYTSHTGVFAALTGNNLGNGLFLCPVYNATNVTLQVEQGPVITNSNLSLSATSIVEGGAVTLSGSFTPDDATDGHSIVINWADGTASTSLNLAPGVSHFSAPHPYLNENPGGPSYLITVTVTDDDACGWSSATINLTVNDAVPTVTSSSPAVSAVENATAHNSGSFADFDDAVTISASTGTVTQSGSQSGTWNWSGTADEGSLLVTITATNADGTTASTSFTATFTDPAVVASGPTGGFSSTYGTPIAAGTVLATFTDPAGAEPNASDPGGPLGSHYSALIHWGDGSADSPGVISFTGAPGSATDTFTVTGSPHAYPAAGTYTLTVTINHEGMISTVQDAVLIARANAIIGVSPYSVTYDTHPHSATGSATGVNGEDLSSLLDLSGTTHTSAGAFVDTWTFTDTTGNYYNASGTIHDSIARANAIITVVPYSVTYDGSPHTATGSAIGVNGASLAGLELSATTHTNAGSYTDSWTFTDSTGNYNNAGGTIHDNIARANAIITVAPYSDTYDGSSHSATGTVTGVGGDGALAGLNLSATIHTHAGNYIDSWTFTDVTGNYTNASSTVIDNVAQADPVITVTPYSVTYDGNPHTATGSATGVNGESLEGLDLSGTTHTHAGSYTDSWTFTDSTGNYNDATGTVNDNIARANAIITVTPYSVTYDGNPHTASGSATGVNGESLAGLDLSGTTHTNAGNYTDSWTFTDTTGNYNDAGGTVIDSIPRATAVIVVTSYSVTYDGSPHTATGSATGVNGASLAGLDLSGTTHTNAGSYTDTWIFTDTTGNYNNSSSTIHDSIARANAIVTITPYSVTYDGTAHSATGTATGVGGDGALAGLDLSASTHTHAGSYPDGWTFTDVTGNYNNASGTVNDSIARANAIITVTPYTVTYDSTVHSATGSAMGVQGESLAGLDLSATIHTPAGSYPDGWTFIDVTGDYNNASGSVNDSIARANASLTVTPYSVTYDGNPHTATGSAIGVKGENLAGLDLSGTTHTNAGSYTDSWTFTDSTGNYTNAGGTVNDQIVSVNSAPPLGLLVLDPSGSGALTDTGRGSIVVTGGGAIVVDSSAAAAATLTGDGSVRAAAILITGGTRTTGRGTFTTAVQHPSPTPDPLRLPLPPAPAPTFAAVNYSGSAPLLLSPGTYVGGIKISGRGSVTLLPGIYYLKGGGFSVTGAGSVTGCGVLIVNAPKSASDSITLSGQGDVNLTPSSSLSGAYAAYNGIALFQDPASPAALTLAGQGSLTLSGVLYAPRALLAITGQGGLLVNTDAASKHATVIVADVRVTGNGGLTINVKAPTCFPGSFPLASTATCAFLVHPPPLPRGNGADPFNGDDGVFGPSGDVVRGTADDLVSTARAGSDLPQLAIDTVLSEWANPDRWPGPLASS